MCGRFFVFSDCSPFAHAFHPPPRDGDCLLLLAFALNAAIAVAAPVFGWGADEPPGMVRLTVLISGFAAMWGLSAALFAQAAHEHGDKA